MQNIATGAQTNMYVNVLKRWWWLPLLFGLFSAGATYVGTKELMKPEYGASTTLQVQSLSTTAPQNLPTDANAIATLMTTGNVQAYVAPFLKTPPASRDPRALYRVSCAADAFDRFVTCTTTSRYPLAAAVVVNTLARKFITYYQNLTATSFSGQLKGLDSRIANGNTELNKINVQMQHLRTTGQAGSAQYTSLQSQKTLLTTNLNQLQVQKSAVQTNINQVSGHLYVATWASKKPNQVSPHPARNAVLGLIVGLGLAAALIVLLEYLDDTFRTSDEVSEATGLNVLGSVRRYDGPPEEMGMVAANRSRTAMAEAYRVARANIQFTNVSGSLKVIVVTSARDGEGKTTTANNLATTFALAGQRVLLMDADLRRPGLTKMLGMKSDAGLSTALIDPDVNVVQSTSVAGLSVVPSGPIPPNPSELLGSQRMRDWIDELARRYDVIVLDTPPVLSVADTRIVATLADGVVFVLDPGITSRRMVRQACAAVENVGARILGVILNRDTMRGEGYYYNYYYYDKSGDREGHQGTATRG